MPDFATEHLSLTGAPFFLFLLLDVTTDDRFIFADSRDQIASRPEMLAHEVALSPSKSARCEP